MSPDASTVVDRARAVADSVLFPRAQDVDRGLVPVEHGLRALADDGQFGIAGPATHGGGDLDARTARRVIAAVSSGCGATFFVWVQHLGVVRSLRASGNDSLVGDLLASMCSGELIAGVAFAHARRPGPPAVRATPLPDGRWRLDGHAPWVTSWGIADWFCVAAESEAGELVWTMIPGSAPAGVKATALDLPVFASTGTVALSFEGCTIPSRHVVMIEQASNWRAGDRVRAAVGQSAVLGVADRAIRLLHDVAHRDLADGEHVADAAQRLARELDAIWGAMTNSSTLTRAATSRPTSQRQAITVPPASSSPSVRPPRCSRRPVDGGWTSPTPRSASPGRPTSTSSRPRPPTAEPQRCDRSERWRSSARS